MKAIAYLINNIEALKEAEALSLPKGEKPKFVELEIYFPLCAVGLAFLIEDEEVTKIKIIIAGHLQILKYEEPVWAQITNYLQNT